MTHDDINALSENRDYLDDIKLGSDEWDTDSSRCSRVGGIDKKKRLYDLLENKRLRQELEDLDGYLDCNAYDDDILGRYYDEGSEERS